MRHQPTTSDVRKEAGQARNLYVVNPNDLDNCYASLALAAAAAIAVVPAGQTIHFLLHDGTYADAVDFGTQHPVVVESLRYRAATISGALSFGAKVAILRSNLRYLNFASTGAVNINDGNSILIEDSMLTDNVLTMSPGAGVAGYEAIFENVDIGGSRFIEDALPGAGTRQLVFKNCASMRFSFVSNPTFVMRKSDIFFTNCYLLSFPIGNVATFDLNGGTSRIYFRNVSVEYDSSNTSSAFFVNAGTGRVDWNNTEIKPNTFFNFGVVGGTVIGAPHISKPQGIMTSAGLTSPPLGTTWHDTRTDELLTWNGTYWVVGDLVRVETLAGVGGAAADHDLGWNVPAGFAVVKTSIRLLKAITGAAGGVKVGFGTKAAGDPNKYGLTGALTVGNPDQVLNPTYNDGAADDLGLTACDAAGAAAGTIAGSGTADARTMVWMRPPVTLAS